ncbi:MAG: enoyl-CoA hydratase/isomerase family protein [Alphaproteobacteria bacterium]|nr:enoyl-CoA hydratase/isomerase family protein [Alphaproteobacteria bacterium]
MSETVLYETSGKVAVIRLNRPEKLNAQTLEMTAAYFAAMKRADADDAVGAMIVTGNGRGFSTGADFKDRFQRHIEEADADATSELPRPGQGWMELVRGAKPIIAAVNGLAVGMGLTQILAFDYIVASSEARFSTPFVKIGLVPEAYGTRFLIARMGWGAAHEFALSGRMIDADEALRSGLVDRVVPHEKLMDEAFAVARPIAENPLPMLRATKRLFTQNSAESDLRQVGLRELEAIEAARRSPEHRAAVAKFLKG